MSRLILPVDTHSSFVVALMEPPGFRVQAVVHEMLPGIEQYRRLFSADKRCADELAAFYDDVMKELHTGHQLFALALEDVTAVQASLF